MSDRKGMRVARPRRGAHLSLSAGDPDSSVPNAIFSLDCTSGARSDGTLTLSAPAATSASSSSICSAVPSVTSDVAHLPSAGAVSRRHGDLDEDGLPVHGVGRRAPLPVRKSQRSKIDVHSVLLAPRLAPLPAAPNR